MSGANITGGFVEIAGNIITAIGPAASFEFAGAIIKLLKGEEVLSNVFENMMFRKPLM